MPFDLIRPAQRIDLDAPRKHRHTVKRIYDRLIAEHGVHDVSYPVVRAYVAERKPQIRAEASQPVSSAATLPSAPILASP